MYFPLRLLYRVRTGTLFYNALYRRISFKPFRSLGFPNQSLLSTETNIRKPLDSLGGEK